MVQAIGATWYVAPGPPGSGLSGGSCAAPGFNTIQGAITAAAPGDTVMVCPGVYTEQLLVTKSLTLTGAGMGVSTIQAPGVLAPGFHGYYSLVEINGPIAVTMSGFTVSGPGPGGCGSLHYGIFIIGGATATISQNEVIHIRDNPLSGCQNGGGIRVGSNYWASSGTAFITNNVVSDYQKGGIIADGLGTSAIISGNTVTGVGPTPFIAQNGIQMSRGASGTITNNVVSGNECNHASCGPNLDFQYSSAGILPYNDVPGAASIGISGNTVTGNDIGIVPVYTNGIHIADNTISDNRFANIALFANGTSIVGNTIGVTTPGAMASNCTAGSYCLGHSYTLGIDVLDGSTGNMILANVIGVTADQYAILLDSISCGNTVTWNNLNSNNGASQGNAAVLSLCSNTVLSNFYSVFFKQPSFTFLSCTGPVSVGGATTCVVTVLGTFKSNPPETVAFYASGPGAFDSPTCSLASSLTNYRSCSVHFTPSSAVQFTPSPTPLTIMAFYGGDANNLGSAGSADVKVNPLINPQGIVGTCGSIVLLVGTSVQCTVTVAGLSPTGTVTWSASGSGGVSVSPSSCTLVAAQCQVTVKATSLGSVTLKLTYSGDPNNGGGSNSFSLTVGSVSISCSSVPSVRKSTLCTATVTGTPTPTGKITWSTSGTGRFSALSCKLSKLGACSVRYTPTAPGSPVIITATYSGDSRNPSSLGVFNLAVT